MYLELLKHRFKLIIWRGFGKENNQGYRNDCNLLLVKSFVCFIKDSKSYMVQLLYLTRFSLQHFFFFW